VDSNSQASIIVEKAIELAHKLNMTVVAEGVEDQASLIKLKELGCDLVQGYLLGRPMMPEELATWMPSGMAPEFLHGASLCLPR
jgi:EAL domain-containing protein (putative c-di-GMP-specific phosphodiesterase class I)